MLVALLLLSSVFSPKTTFDDANREAVPKKLTLKEKAQWLQNFITPQRKTNREMSTKHYTTMEKVLNEIKEALGISNTPKFDYNYMIELIGIKLRYGDAFDKKPDIEASSINQPTKDDLQCVDSIAMIQVPQNIPFKDAEVEVTPKQLEKNELDDMTEEQKKKELELFQKVYEAHKKLIENEIREIKKLLEYRREEEEKKKKFEEDHKKREEENKKKGIKNTPKREYKSGVNAQTFLKNAQDRMDEILKNSRALSSCRRDNSPKYEKIVESLGEVNQEINNEIAEVTKEIQKEKEQPLDKKEEKKE